MTKIPMKQGATAAMALALLATVGVGPASAQDFEAYYEAFGFGRLGAWTCHAMSATHAAPTACLYVEGRTTLGMVIILGSILVVTGLAWRHSFERAFRAPAGHWHWPATDGRSAAAWRRSASGRPRSETRPSRRRR